MTNYNIFVAMPFGTKKANNKRYSIDFDAIYNKAIKPAADELKTSIIRADEENDGGIIHALMIERLVCTDIVIADITNDNPNVYYELGIRHCARPCTTILIYDKSTRLPFDIQPLRAIPYELERGRISDLSAEALKNNLINRIKSVTDSEQKCDSLPFALIEDFPRTELNEMKLQIYQERQKQRNDYLDNLKQVKTIVELNDLIDDMVNKSFPFQYLIFELIKSFQKIKAWDELIQFVDTKLDKEVKDLLYVKQQYALAYNKKGQVNDIQTSINLLRDLVKDYGDSSETHGLVGSAYKQLMLRSSSESTYKAYLDRAILNYKAGFDFDSRDYFTGINVATLLLLKNTDESLANMNAILPVLKYNIELNDFEITNDYWLLATAFELYILYQNFDKAMKIFGFICTLNPNPDEWMIESTIGNLALIKRVYETKSLPVDWYDQYKSLVSKKEN